MDKMFGAGTVQASGSGGSKTNFKNINKPFEFRKA
jgi:hypothetical protein